MLNSGLDSFPGFSSFPWHVHQYPFPHDAKRNPCRSEITGGHYDPLGAYSDGNYTANCAANQSLCELGDLSGRWGPLNDTASSYTFTDGFLSLYGIYSIIGRSIVIHYTNTSRLACANIGYPANTGDGQANILFTPFRNMFTGSIYFRQHTNNSTASVYTDLISVGSLVNSTGHNWHVHESPLDRDGNDCSIAGPHYNPRGVNASSSTYSDLCNPRNQNNCEVGDLSGKGSPFSVMNRVIKQFYSDTDLPFSIDGRSVVIHEANRGAPRIACANISRYFPLQAEAIFTSQDGIDGSIRFLQLSPFDQTRVDVNLTGLRRMIGGYHVHQYPIGPANLGMPERCNGTFAGGHWNPLQVVYGRNPPITSDGYEIGDLSGKFGSLQNRDTISQSFYDPNVPLFGAFGIIGRSIVIHMDDQAGTRRVCANIVHTQPIVRVVYSINTSSIVGEVTLLQPANDPSAATTIIVELEVIMELLLPPQPTTSIMASPFITSSPTLSPSPSPFPSMAPSVMAPTTSSVAPSVMVPTTTSELPSVSPSAETSFQTSSFFPTTTSEIQGMK